MKFEKERERKQIRKKRERGYMQVTRKGDSYNKSRERSTKRKEKKRAVVVVEWSVCLPSSPTIRVRIEVYIFSGKFVFD